MKFKSLQSKYQLLITLLLTALAIVISVVCVTNYSAALEQVAASRMNLVTTSFAKEVKAKYDDIAQTTNTLADYMVDTLDSTKRLANDDSYRKKYIEDVDDFASRIMRTDSVASSYFARLNIKTINPNAGFRYERNDAGKFKPTKTIDIKAYDEDDFEHVGWYYAPIRMSMPVWMDPYFDASQGQYKVTYAVPVYHDGELLAVVGTDVVFQTLVDSVNALVGTTPDATVFLCGKDGEMYYHKGVDVSSDTVRAKDFDPAGSLSGSSDGSIYDGTLSGEKVKYAYEELFGDVFLVEARPVGGIFQSLGDLVTTIAITATAFVLIGIALATLVGRSIVKPLRRLDDATSNILDDNAIFELEVSGEDEVATLTRHFQEVAHELKTSLDHLNSIAYRDGLTGVRNKRGYDIEVDTLNEQIARDEAKFGVAVFDVNGLKETNDTYGHEAGNEVIISASTRIKECFKYSTVFRIGGDEFVCILRGSDLEDLEKRLEYFRKLAVAENAIADEPWQEVYVAVGTAAFHPHEDASVADVFARADEGMYRNKAAMKGEDNVR